MLVMGCIFRDPPNCNAENGEPFGTMPIAKDIIDAPMFDFAPSEELSSPSYVSVEPPRGGMRLREPMRKDFFMLKLRLLGFGELGYCGRGEEGRDAERSLPYTGMLGLL